MHRVVSLIASATEMVAALDCEDLLVGRSHECDYPPAVEALPVCSEPRFDTAGTSRQIDERVKATLAEALSVYRVFSDELARLEPTLIITQTQCDVCAVSLSDVESAVARLVGGKPQIVALEPMSLDDVWRDIGRVAGALGVAERGESLVGRLQERLAAIRAAAAELPGRPRIACLEWIDPLMSAGNWVPELVSLAGGDDLFGQPGQHSDWMTWDELRAADPELIAIMPCGFDIDRTRQELPVLTERSEWQSLEAVRNGHVYLVDGNQYMNRPGPRLVESAEIFAEILHPDALHFGHEEDGWQRIGNSSGG